MKRTDLHVVLDDLKDRRRVLEAELDVLDRQRDRLAGTLKLVQKKIALMINRLDEGRINL